MALENEGKKGTFVSVLSDGLFHQTVEEGIAGAKLREYETSTGEKGSKWEKTFTKASGYIGDISFYDGDYGKILQVEIRDLGCEPLTVSLNTASPFGESVMKQLPLVDFNEPVTLKPYAFTDDKGKTRKGVTLYQGQEKLRNFFFDVDSKATINGMPEPENNGEGFETDDWKMYYMQVRKFLVKYTEDEIIPKVEVARENHPDGLSANETEDIAF